MKKLFAVMLIMFMMQTGFAQQAGGFRFQMDLGAAIPKDGGIGALVNLEPQILILDNLAFGLRLGMAGLAKDVVYTNSTEDYDGDIAGNASIVSTLNYYLNNGSSRVAPYVGAGFGYYGLSNIKIEDSNIAKEDIGDLEAAFAWAPMARAGVEVGKFRMGVEYNFIPNSNLQNVNGQVIGQAVNKYFGFTLGFFVGGGKWGK
ncbi:hypothetical protein [Algoriphagus sp.]|uniref:hypothetical protein n=1 Tax=Algoriphagus sp. TaxID=1872435 RepID=UPI00391A1EC8